VPSEPLSPELVLVDPDLAARARAALPMPSLAPSRPVVTPAQTPVAAPRVAAAHPYPMWARITAALWLVVLGILIGGTAIPHAQDTPHLLPKGSEPTVCKPKPAEPTPAPTSIPNRHGQ